MGKRIERSVWFYTRDCWLDERLIKQAEGVSVVWTVYWKQKGPMAMEQQFGPSLQMSRCPKGAPEVRASTCINCIGLGPAMGLAISSVYDCQLCLTYWGKKITVL